MSTPTCTCSNAGVGSTFGHLPNCPMVSQRTTPDEQLAVLTEMVARMPHTPDRRTSAEVERDNWLEDLAELRADERALPASDRDQDRAADLYYGGSR